VPSGLQIIQIIFKNLSHLTVNTLPAKYKASLSYLGEESLKFVRNTVTPTQGRGQSGVGEAVGPGQQSRWGNKMNILMGGRVGEKNFISALKTF
jgi:hypothetical protein